MASQSPNHHALDPRLGPAPPSTTSIPQHQGLQFEHPPPGHAQTPNNPYAQPSPQAYYPNYPPPPPQAHASQPASTGSQSNQASPAIGSFQQHQTPQNQSQNQNQEAEHSADDDGPNEGPSGDGGDAKRPRACEACRGLKVRCDQDPQHPDIPCRRCQKAGRPCVITAPSRKRQKKADNRVAELERKLDVLTAVLQQQQQNQQQQNVMQAMPPQQQQQPYAPLHQAPRAPSAGPSMQPPPQKRRRTEDSNPSPQDSGYPPAPTGPEDVNGTIMQTCPRPYMTSHMPPRSQEDFINRIHALVSPEIGTKLFDRYITKLSPHMPAVIFPSDTTAEQVRKERPILYVCILTAASAGILHPDISRDLARESIRTIADCVVVNGAKSLELIQAMQVTALWYKPPEKAEQTNFYQIIHMAAVMAIDIGLGKRFNGAAAKAKRGVGFSGPPHADIPPPGSSSSNMLLPQNSDTLEARRAWLGCYYMCASASMVLRRPNLVHWSNYMKECVDILSSTSPEAAPSDKMFCQHIKIQHICEEIGVQFFMDDHTATVSITDPKVTYTLNVLENELKAWKEGIPAELKEEESLVFFEHVASLYLHEIALHFNHNVEDFRLPFTEESLKTVNNSSETLTHHQVSALIACRTAAHGILDTMLGFELETIKSLPMLIFFVRCTYSMVILIKMHVSISTPGSEIGKMMTAEELRVEDYLDGLINMFARVHEEEPEEFRPHPKILRILTVLREWFLRHKANVGAGQQQQLQDVKSEREAGGGGGMYTGGGGPTPLDLLSQAAAAGNSQQQQRTTPTTQQQQQQNWAVNNAGGYPYPPPPQQSMGDNSGAGGGGYSQQQQTFGPYTDGGNPSSWATTTTGEVPYGIIDWGSGFQQAMDLNLGGMEGLNGGGIDGLFMGDGMMPFMGGGGAPGFAGGEF